MLRQHPPADGARSARSAYLKVPAGRHLVMVLTHAHALADDAEAFVSLYGEQLWRRPTFTGSDNGFFRGSVPRRTSTADVSVFAGEELQVLLDLVSGSKAPTATQTGWDIDDIAVYTCDDDLPSGPAELVIKPGYDEVLTTWEPPAWRPELVTGYQVRLHDVGDWSRDRVVELDADARQWRFTDMPPGRTYQVSVSSGPADRSTSSVQIEPSSVQLTGSRSQTVQYTNWVTIRGETVVGSLILQKRYLSTGSWVNSGSVRVNEDGRWRVDPTPTRNTQYRVASEPRIFTTSARMGSFSSTFTAKVMTSVSVWGKWGAKTWEPVTVKGHVHPAHPGMTVLLQRAYSDGWRTVSSAKTSESSYFGFKFYKKAGKYTYRVIAPSHSDHAQGTSERFDVHVFSH